MPIIVFLELLENSLVLMTRYFNFYIVAYLSLCIYIQLSIYLLSPFQVDGEPYEAFLQEAFESINISSHPYAAPKVLRIVLGT